MNVFILCAGEQLRFPYGFMPKQLLAIKGESLLSRQFRQCLSLSLNPVVVTHRSELQSNAWQWLMPVDSQNILRTLKSTEPLWTERVTVLLGDVHFDDDLAYEILTDTGGIKFWLGGSEIFAIAFDLKDYQTIRDAITVADTVPGHPNRVADRKMWHLYRAMHSDDIHTHQTWDSPITINVEGRAFDVDSYRQYLDLIRDQP